MQPLIVVKNLLIKDESLETVRSILVYLRDIKKGKYNQELVNVVCQHGHYSSAFDLYDAYYFSIIHKHIIDGKLLYKKIYVGEAPSQNDQIEENNRKLRNLPEPFSAAFIPSVGRGAEDDGFLECTTEKTALNKLENGRETEVEISMLNVRLEVGTTESHTTHKHIFLHNGVARWPYYSKHLYIIYNPTPFSLKFQKYISETGAPEEKIEEKEIANYNLEYRGEQDSHKLTELFEEINELVRRSNCPTNLYTFTNSQLDVALLDFKEIDLSETIFREICVISILNHHNIKTSQLVVRSNSAITVSAHIKATSGEKSNYQFLAISFEISCSTL